MYGSVTVHVRENKWEDVEQWVWDHWGDVVALSFLSYDDSFYELRKSTKRNTSAAKRGCASSIRRRSAEWDCRGTFSPNGFQLRKFSWINNETIAHKSNDSLLLPGVFAYWIAGRLSLCPAAIGTGKSPKPFEIRAFGQKKHRNSDTHCIKIAVLIWWR